MLSSITSEFNDWLRSNHLKKSISVWSQVMQEHPKTGGVCAQMQPKRSKNNLQIFMQIFEYLTGHMMFKVGMKSFQLNQF